MGFLKRNKERNEWMVHEKELSRLLGVKTVMGPLSERHDFAALVACERLIGDGLKVEDLLSDAGLRHVASVSSQSPEGARQSVERFRERGWLDRLIELRTERRQAQCTVCYHAPWVKTYELTPHTYEKDGETRVDEGHEKLCETCSRMFDANQLDELARHRLDMIGAPKLVSYEVALQISREVVGTLHARRVDRN